MGPQWLQRKSIFNQIWIRPYSIVGNSLWVVNHQLCIQQISVIFILHNQKLFLHNEPFSLCNIHFYRKLVNNRKPLLTCYYWWQYQTCRCKKIGLYLFYANSWTCGAASRQSFQIKCWIINSGICVCHIKMSRSWQNYKL